jgi:glycosyltransferase involved in cell wall biosynthesis
VRALILLKTAAGGYWSVAPAVTLAERGHEVIFALPSNEGPLPDQVRAAGLEVVVAAAPRPDAGPWRQPAAVGRLRRQLRALDPAVVVSHLYASALAGRFACWRTGTPHVFMSPGPLYLESRLIHAAERVLWHLDAHVIASSGALDEAYRDLGVPADRRSMIPYSVDPGWAGPVSPAQRAAARRDLDLAPTDFVACCVAYVYAPKRLVHRGKGIKGHDVLLEAWRRYRAGGGGGLLAIVGGGYRPGGEAHLAALRQAFGEVDGVRWVGPTDDVRPWYRAADVSVAPSRSENYGAAAEASLLGCPTIASRVGALPELVVEDDTGWLVPPDDPPALARALAAAAATGPDERHRKGERARRRAEVLFDATTNRTAFADLVERVAADAHG